MSGRGTNVQHHRAAGRPSVAVLSRGLIFETALRLLDERGENGFGMREIARALGVRPSALYNHVRSKEDVLDGIRDLIVARFDLSGFGVLPWDEALAQWARSYMGSFAAHPPTIAMLAVQPVAQGSRTSLMYEAVTAGLMDAGWPADRVFEVIVGLESFIIGSAFDQAAPQDMFDPSDDAGLPAMRRAYDAREQSLEGERPSSRAFERGLRVMLSGLRAELAQLNRDTDAD